MEDQWHYVLSVLEELGKNNSWIISTILESPFCSSSCCQAYFPSIVRPMNRLWELVLKSFFYSPEMNRSILFSMYLLRMTKKIITFFEISYAERECFPVQYQSNALCSSEWYSVNNQQVPFFVVLLLSLTKTQNLSHPVVTHVLRADLQELLCRCFSNPSQIYLIHEKF